MDSSVSPKDEIWFLRMCHHISNALYIRIVSGMSLIVRNNRRPSHTQVLHSTPHSISAPVLHLALAHKGLNTELIYAEDENSEQRTTAYTCISLTAQCRALVLLSDSAREVADTPSYCAHFCSAQCFVTGGHHDQCGRQHCNE